MRSLTLVTLLAVTLLIGGCVVSGPVAGANPYPPPPPVQAEMIPKPPVSEDALIWQPGHWDWTGGSYVWSQGAWITRAGHGTSWQDGYWAISQAGQWVWIAAHWV